MRRILMALAVAMSLGGVSRADYTGLGPALPYNDYVLGNFTQVGTDAGGSGTNNGMGVAVGGNFAPAGGGGFTVNGPVVVGGDYTNSGGQIGQQGQTYGNIYATNVTFSSETVYGTVYARNNLTISGGSEPTGGEYYVGIPNIPNYFTNSHKVAASALPTPPVDFTTGNAYLKNESTYLSSISSTVGVNHTGQILTLTGSGSNFYDFQVTASDFSSINTLTVNVAGLNGTTPTVVINVLNGNAGTVSFANITPTYNGTNKQYVLYNFAGTSAINTNNTGIRGSVLAPYSSVNFSGGNIDGTMIAGNLSGGGESHAFAFLGNANLRTVPQAVPEPGSIALVLIGGLASGLMLRRRAKRNPAA